MDDPRTIHDDVLGLYLKLELKQVRFRMPDRATHQPKHLDFSGRYLSVDRDRLVCALLNKAATTKRAVVVLCDAELGDDAYALSRVLLELSVYLAWMTSGDWPARIDSYAFFSAPTIRRLANVMKEHYEGGALEDVADGTLENEEAAAIAEEMFGDRWTKWARVPDANRPGQLRPVDLKEMISDLDSVHTLPKTGNITYALGYFDASQFIHSLPRALSFFLRDAKLSQHYYVREHAQPDLVRAALAFSNIWMLHALAAVNAFTSAGLDEEIDAITDRMVPDGNARQAVRA